MSDRSAIPAAPSAAATLGDLGTVALAGGVVLGAWVSRPVPLVIGIGVVGLALAVRRPGLLVLGAALVASALGARAWSGLEPPASGPIEGAVTLVADPRPTAFGAKADVRSGSKRFELRASQEAGGGLLAALAGEVVVVSGRIRSPPDAAPWLVPRHVVATIEADQVERVGAGSAPWRAANRFRRLLDRGAAHLGEDARALYGGFVLGDDRDQSPEVVDDFRGAGLTHVLVVSGQNIRTAML